MITGIINTKATIKGILGGGSLTGSVSIGSFHPEEYSGSYAITPQSVPITLDTHGKMMVDDLVVNPIPSNYGLITWDGFSLTVS